MTTLFQVRNLKTNKQCTVFSVLEGSTGLRFLVWEDSRWIAKDADEYEPVEAT